jgi:hypothetical protein
MSIPSRTADAKIKAEIKKVLWKAAVKSRSIIEAKTKNLLKKAITNTPEYQSVVGGALKFEFGIPEGHVKFNEIISEWIDSVEAVVRPVKSSPNMLMRVRGVQSNYSDVLALDGATQEPTNTRGIHGPPLEWLRWLLLEGSNFVVMDAQLGGDRKGHSRTQGPHIMLPDPKRNKLYKVPERYQGVKKDNFITRAIDNVKPEIEELIEIEFVRRVK